MTLSQLIYHPLSCIGRNLTPKTDRFAETPLMPHRPAPVTSPPTASSLRVPDPTHPGWRTTGTSRSRHPGLSSASLQDRQHRCLRPLQAVGRNRVGAVQLREIGESPTDIYQLRHADV
jgi:hypothetical protein